MDVPLKKVMLRDFDGGLSPFDTRALQTRLIDCFLDSGRGDAGYLAEDIALALEYTLLTAPRPEPVFGTGEVDAAVVRTLEETGFPEVARRFRDGARESMVLLSTRPESVAQLLEGHLSCSPERLRAVVLEVADAAEKLGIDRAAPHLLLELARHFERCRAEKDQLPDRVPASGVVTTLSAAEITVLLPEDPRTLADAGILRINGVTRLFPSVRFFFRMMGFARFHHLSLPLTELELLPKLYPAGAALESARCAINARLGVVPPPPCCLTIPDMSDFLNACCGPGNHSALGNELAGILADGISCPLYKLTVL